MESVFEIYLEPRLASVPSIRHSGQLLFLKSLQAVQIRAEMFPSPSKIIFTANEDDEDTAVERDFESNRVASTLRSKNSGLCVSQR